jgi:hypothetical protein
MLFIETIFMTSYQSLAAGIKAYKERKVLISPEDLSQCLSELPVEKLPMGTEPKSVVEDDRTEFGNRWVFRKRK